MHDTHPPGRQWFWVKVMHSFATEPVSAVIYNRSGENMASIVAKLSSSKQTKKEEYGAERSPPPFLVWLSHCCAHLGPHHPPCYTHTLNNQMVGRNHGPDRGLSPILTNFDQFLQFQNYNCLISPEMSAKIYKNLLFVGSIKTHVSYISLPLEELESRRALGTNIA